MHPAIESRRNILSALRERSALATAQFYALAGIDLPAITFRLAVKPAGRGFFHVVDSQNGKVLGFRRDHNEACALARRLETEARP